MNKNTAKFTEDDCFIEMEVDDDDQDQFPSHSDGEITESDEESQEKLSQDSINNNATATNELEKS